MRVIRHYRYRRTGDRGAVLVVVAAFMMVAVLFVAFVVDIGNQRQNRRQLTTETDAVALAVAQEWADASLTSWDECSDTLYASRLAVVNNPNQNAAANPACSFVSPNPFQGYVTVSDGETAEFAFGGVTGVEAGSTGASSTVAVSARRGGGLRPLALCALDPNLASWIATGAPAEFDIFATRGLVVPLCADTTAVGNWGQVVLPPSRANQNDWTDDVENGAEDPVTVNQQLANLTGVGMNSAAQEFEALEGTDFFLPVYSYADRSRGSDVSYPVTGFVEVRLVGSDISGSSPSFTIRPLRYQTTGTCCFVNGFNAELELCDVGDIGGGTGSDRGSNCLATLPPAVSPTVPPPMCTATISGATSQASAVTVARGLGGLASSVTYTYTLPTPAACTGSFTAAALRGGTTAATVSATVSGGTVTATFPSGTTDFQPDRIYTIELRHGSAPVEVSGRLDTSTP